MLNSAWIQRQLRLHEEFKRAIGPRLEQQRTQAAFGSDLVHQVQAERARFDAFAGEQDIKKALGELDPSKAVYRERDEAEVAFERNRWAKTALVRCSHDLGLGRVRLQWFDDLNAQDPHDYRWHLGRYGAPPWKTWFHDGPCLGLYSAYQPDVIHIKTSDDPRQLVFVVAHEARHAWQDRQYGMPGVRTAAHFGGNHESEKRWSEEDADAYAQGVLTEFGHN